jgi:hypothetical protein
MIIFVLFINFIKNLRFPNPCKDISYIKIHSTISLCFILIKYIFLILKITNGYKIFFVILIIIFEYSEIVIK